MSADGPIYDKFQVFRSDGKHAPGEKHHGCQYFVLDLRHDAFAYPALEAYASACEATHPMLADDLRNLIALGPPEKPS